ncbi:MULTISPECIES: polyketide cyclase [unclassified Streptomyces]|uniref:polyketide cyclase n=1 Tax=unclassified Streptomyces TaxID=2593676 RepID=UPI0004C593FC|nr:polyketide cyclase [Streptomyces sp. NRRL F-5630]
MTDSIRHLSIHIDRTRDDVYAFASNPENLPAWALGLGGSLVREGDEWVASDAPMGRVTVAFVPPNDLGVLDHDVTLPDGEVFNNPLRVITDGTGSLVVFTLRRPAGATDAEFERDAEMVTADLARLKELLESA